MRGGNERPRSRDTLQPSMSILRDLFMCVRYLTEGCSLSTRMNQNVGKRLLPWSDLKASGILIISILSQREI